MQSLTWSGVGGNSIAIRSRARETVNFVMFTERQREKDAKPAAKAQGFRYKPAGQKGEGYVRPLWLILKSTGPTASY
jgi:hypothetical protein